MRYRTTIQLVFLAIVTITSVNCNGGTEYVVREEDPEVRAIGDACVLDSECESGRCVGGICDDGLCDEDSPCPTDELCVFGECVPADEFACTEGQAPLIGVDPLDIDFGEVAIGNTQETTVTIENRGDCLMTISGVSLASDADPAFSCSPCDVSAFPMLIAPQRTMNITVSFSPTTPGAAATELLINSDDVTAGDEGLVSVALEARYSGIPLIVVDPAELHFGTVNQGSSRSETVRVTNEGTGNAVLTIQSVYITGDDDFTIPTEFAGIEPPTPFLLAPYDAANEVVCGADYATIESCNVLEIPVTLTPNLSQPANFEADLKIQAHYGDPTASDRFSTHLTGTSLGPPQISVTPTSLVFQDDLGEAYGVGSVNFRQVTIQNMGQSELITNMSLQDPTGDFSLSPSFLPPIAPGGSVIVSVFYSPSAPSDPANENEPQTPVSAFFNITSNDDDPAEDVLKVISLEGWAKGGTFDDILKLEMEYENADNSWAGNDFRDVDMELISQVGFSCTKPIYQYVSDGNGNYVVDPALTEDPCDDWNNYGQLGTANWLALGQYEEPERILLYGLGQDNANGDTFTVRVHYVEDCANIPTGILGDILGIGLSAIFGIIGASAGVPISLPPDQISDLVTENCWDHDNSETTVHVYINGEEVASPTFNLQDKGDYHDIIKLKRENGVFTILN